MGTPFDTVYDRALTTIRDYKLDKLAKADYESFILYWQSILEISVPDFTSCFTSLDYDITARAFNENLSNKEINILAKIMVAGWFTGQVQDVVQFQLHLSNCFYTVLIYSDIYLNSFELLESPKSLINYNARIKYA